MKKNAQKQKSYNIEAQFKSRDEFLKWRQKVLQNYEKSKNEYQLEVEYLFGRK